jgi:hypothetical protein
MRLSLRNMALAGVLATGIMALGTTQAKAQGYGGYGQGYGGYGGGGYGQGYGGYGQGYSSYGAPTQQYYGNGGHDLQPHWHTTQTPIGSFGWYGNGAHDLQPHEHTRSAYGGYRGYSPSPFGGVTTSYYNSTPYIYMPW